MIFFIKYFKFTYKALNNKFIAVNLGKLVNIDCK